MNSITNSSPLIIPNPPMNWVTWSYFTVIFLAIVTCVCGVVGNAIVVWLLSFRMRRSPFCVYVLNLAVADLLFLLCMIFLLSLETGPLLLNSPSIRIYDVIKRTKYFAYTAGLSLLTAISTQRCVSVLFPIWYRCHQPRHLSTVVCSVLWGLSVLMNFMSSFFCAHFWQPNEHQCFRVDMVFSGLIMGIFMPVMTLSSVTLFIQVRRSGLLQRRRLRRLYLVILVSVFIFLTCSLPLGIYWFFLYWMDLPQDVKVLYYGIARCFSSISSSANPLIYFLVGSQRNQKRQESLGTVLGRALRDEPELEGRETPSMATSEEI